VPREGWQTLLWARMRHRFALKTAGICLFMWVFFIAYFQVLRHPAGPVLTMPLTGLDRAIPFMPQALVFYVSLWFYVGIPPGLMLNLRELLAYGAWIGALCLAGLGCFYLWPTAVPRQVLDIDLARHPGFALLQGVDASGNACPSLHVATAVFTALWVGQLLRLIGAPAALRLLNGAWVLLIAWSTLATRQHVVIDVVSGALLGLAFAIASLRWRPRR
jgi:membrane-associated phospholipid phosphatase